MKSAISKQYPNTAEGAIEALVVMSTYKHSNVLGFPERDPLVEGVWKVTLIYNMKIFDVIVFLAGYKEASGKFRLSNSFEKFN